MTHEEELLYLLKSGAQTGDDEGESTDVGETQLYPDPEQRSSGIDGPWGEAGEPTCDCDSQHSGSAKAEHDKCRRGTIEKALNSKLVADKTEQATIAQNFNHGASEDYETHSIHLRPKSTVKVSHPTNMERVHQLTGRY